MRHLQVGVLGDGLRQLLRRPLLLLSDLAPGSVVLRSDVFPLGGLLELVQELHLVLMVLVLT